MMIRTGELVRERIPSYGPGSGVLQWYMSRLIYLCESLNTSIHFPCVSLLTYSVACEGQ